MNDELLKQCIDDLIEQAESVKEEPEGELRDGKRLAYLEVLSTLKTNLTPLDPEKFGLDFDVDKRFA